MKNTFKIYFSTICFILIIGGNLISQPLIKFKENKNQWPSDVKYMGDFFNGKVFLSNYSFTYDIVNAKQLSSFFESKEAKGKKDLISGHVYKTTFIGAQTQSVSGEDKQSEYYNYFLGNDKSKWSSRVNAFKKITYTNLYNNINMQVYSSGSSFKYDFIVAPGADPSTIKMEIEHADEVNLSDNIISIKTNAGIITEQAPLAYQIIKGKKYIVNCIYKLKNNVVSFEFPTGYNNKYELIIDPIVIACSFTGVNAASSGEASAFDEKGNGYTAGSTQSSLFPTTTGAYQTTFSGSNDATIHKFNYDGSQLLFCTYIGGILDEYCFCAEVFGNNIYLLGYTNSPDFPVGNNTIDNSYNGGSDMFLLKLDTTGSTLINSTYLGGSGDDGAPGGGWLSYSMRNYEFVMDKTGDIYLTSSTTSNDFPVTLNAYSSTNSGGYDAVILKIDNDLQNIIWSTYLGGTNNDSANSLRLDKKGGVYITGSTKSTNFPTTAGAVATGLTGAGTDCFVAHINSTGTSVLASTYIGTIGTDYGSSIALDNDTNVFLYSITPSAISAAYTPTPNTFYVAGGRNFLYKFNTNLTQLLIKTRFGPTSNPTSTDGYYLSSALFEIDSCNNIYIAGDASRNFITTPNAIKTSTNGFDLYFCVLSPNASSLKYATYYGGPNDEYATFGICKMDQRGVLYYSFNGNSNTPVTPNAFSGTTFNDPYFGDHGFLKIDAETFLSATSYSSQLNNGCAPYNISFTNQTPTNNVTWIFGDGSPSVSNVNNVTHTYSQTGTYNMILIAEDTSTCNNIDTLITAIQVFETPQKPLQDSLDICQTGSIELNAANPGLSYLWSTGETTQSITVNNIGTYYLTVSNPGCSITDTSIVYLSKANFPIVIPNIITPNGDGVNDKLTMADLLITEYDLNVYDRWGKLVAHTTTNAWDGTVNGKIIDGTYFYTLKYKTDCVKEWQDAKGFITVVK